MNYISQDDGLARPIVTDSGTKGKILYDALSQDKLELILFPTEQCNFRCVYCYEDFSIGRMSREVVTGIKNLIDIRSPGLKTLHISWFGGEPLSAYDIVRDITVHARTRSLENNFNFIGSITTNGYHLTEPRILELSALGMQKFQITLDGDEQAHNTTRLRIDGAGTFQRIWQNIQCFNRLSLNGNVPGSKVILRVHLHPGNIDGVRRLVERIGGELDPAAFSLHFKAVGHWGGQNDQNFDVFDEHALSYGDVVKSLYASLPGYKPEFNEEIYVCYAAKANSFVIRANGDIGKCTVALSSSKNSIGNVKEDGRLDIEPGKFNSWLHALSSLDREDLACPITRIPSLENAG